MIPISTLRGSDAAMMASICSIITWALPACQRIAPSVMTRTA
jgi:hypothetical protein